MKNRGNLKVTTPSDREVAMTRVFDAPRSMVYDALTKPELVKRWLGVVEGWSFDCSHVWALPVNPSNLPDSTIEIRIAEWDLLYIATAEAESDDEHAYDAQKVAYNRSWDDLDLESTFEHRRENGLIRRKSGRGSWEYEDTQFSNPESINFDTDDLIDAAVEVYLDPRKSSPTISDPRQFELTLETLRRRAGIGKWCTEAVNHPAWPNASLRSASLPGSAAAMLRSIERLAAL